MKKIGIMGGTFNPIHMAHLMLGEFTYHELKLDEVWFMPSKKPPHKQNDVILDDNHRANMVKLAIADNPHFKFSEMELEREGLTFTVDTLSALKRENPTDEYYFIIGADSLLKFHLWREPENILKLAHLVAFGRDHLEDGMITNQIEELIHQYGGKIEYLKAANIDISSSLIREYIKEEKPILYFLPTEVRLYIEENKLYK